ncbi:hypothetical protein PVAP13_3KG241827 [Panicum virgatum]|uniref:Uncharacterized protein n=1 Tax=Panicum virgatum TaxID=38727 RepID=A0A8T0UWX0_PANVG|nr:hypothetical protein PVAP13_3KG241827 [Panicum virgatum]
MHSNWKNTVKKSFLVCLCIQVLNSAIFFCYFNFCSKSSWMWSIGRGHESGEFWTVYKSNITRHIRIKFLHLNAGQEKFYDICVNLFFSIVKGSAILRSYKKTYNDYHFLVLQ